jgi:hypothetical protein
MANLMAISPAGVDRIEMHIISAALEISFVTNGVFPKSLLPNRIFTATIARNCCARSNDASREASLDPSPPV